MKFSIPLFFLLSGFLSASADIAVVGGFPASPVVANPDDTPSTGSTAFTHVANNNTGWKGNSFLLTTPADITSLTFQLNDGTGSTADTTGHLTLKFFNLNGSIDFIANGSDGDGPVPAAAATATMATDSDVLHEQTENFSGLTVSPGDYIQVTLTAPLHLAPGSYGWLLTTADLDLDLELRNTPTFEQGELIRWSHSDAAWQDRANDMVFALAGAVQPLTLDHPATWPVTFLENGPQVSADQAVLSTGIRIGQSFTVAGDAELDTVVLQLDDATASVDLEGSVTVELFVADESGLPTGSALASLTGELPAGLSTGSYLGVDFPGTVSLGYNRYVLVLTSTDTDLVLNATTGDLLADAELLVDNGSGWAVATPAGRDLVFGLTGTLSVRPNPGTGPNILVILADDFGWTDLSSGKTNLGNGSDFYQTPHLDRLTDEGLSFTYAFVQPNCAPTRAALLSGQYAPRSGNGVYNVTSLNRGSGSTSLTPPSQREDVPAAHYNMAEMLYDAGYVTCHIGKYHVGGHDGGSATLPQNQGFDHNFGGNSAGAPGSFFANSSGVFDRPSPTIDAFGARYDATYISTVLAPMQNGNNASTLAGTNKHLTDAEGDAALHFIDSHRTGPLASYPFYLQVHSYAVHTPIQPRPDLKTKYDGLPAGSRHDETGYAGLVEGLDQSVGRIINYLDAGNLSTNTLVIFLSDNGGHEGPTDNVPLRSRKGSFYNGGIRVPMIVRQPGTVPANQVTDTLVHAVDLYPTLMEAAGGSTAEILDGTSYYQHVLNPIGHPRNREPIYYHFPGYLDQRARPCSVVIKEVTGKRFKLIYNYDYTYDPAVNDDAVKVLTQPWELYNITDDISEATNLIDGNYWTWLIYGAIADELAGDLRAWLTQTDPTWNAVQAKDGGVPVPYPAADVPDVIVPVAQMFQVTEVQIDPDAGTSTVTFTSESGYQFDIEGSSNIVDPTGWEAVATRIPGQAGSTTTPAFPDPHLTDQTTRHYRASIRPGP